jgi:hypothetical protein
MIYEIVFSLLFFYSSSFFWGGEAGFESTSTTSGFSSYSAGPSAKFSDFLDYDFLDSQSDSSFANIATLFLGSLFGSTSCSFLLSKT